MAPKSEQWLLKVVCGYIFVCWSSDDASAGVCQLRGPVVDRRAAACRKSPLLESRCDQKLHSCDPIVSLTTFNSDFLGRFSASNPWNNQTSGVLRLQFFGQRTR